MADMKNEKFKIAASHTIGTYVLPGELITNIHQQVNRRITLKIAPCNAIIKAVKAGKIDIGFIEFKIEENNLTCTPWMEDELVFCAKKKLPDALSSNMLKNHSLICAKVESVDRDALNTLLLKQNMHPCDFDSLKEIDNPTTIVQSLKWSNPHAKITPIALVSKRAIEYELAYNHFHLTSINHSKILKRFYVIYRNDATYIHEIKNICKKILNDKKIVGD